MSRRRLLLDAIPADFDPATHVALGPWCFLDAETVYPQWDDLPFVDAFPTPAERYGAGEACRALALQLLDRLWPQMNARHGTAHGRDYWHVVLMDWLLHLVMLSWRLWRHTEIFIAQAGAEELDVGLVTASGRLPFSGTHDFIFACFGKGEFRAWLISAIVRRLAPEHWHVRFGRTIEPMAVVSVAPASKQRMAVEGIGGLGGWQRVLSAYVRAIPCVPRRARRRREPTSADFPATFLTFVDELVETTLPESVRDGFAALEDDAAGQAYRRGQVYATNLNFHDDQANFRLAHAIAAGERIVAVQHGGSYGWAGLLPLLAEMEYWHDVFVSWGWDTHDEYDGRFVPLPYPLLSRNLGGHQPATDEALLVGAAMYGFNPRTDYYTEPLRYRKKKRRFIAALPDELRTKLLYRPYYSPQLPVLDDLAYLKRHFPDLRAHEGQLLPSLLRAKLVVQDHHSTTLSITMSANIPTIGFWSEVDWPLGAQGKALFDRLKRVGIVFDDPEDAARQVARVWPRVHEWWSGADVQAARRAWCRQFARASRLWPLHWMKGLGAIQLGLVP